MVRKSVYGAIRKTSDSGKEWIDIETLSGLHELSREKAERENQLCGPFWAKNNPVVRVVSISLLETTDADDLVYHYKHSSERKWN